MESSVAEPLDSQDARRARWYVVQTHQHCEVLAERHLSSQNFRTYLPKRRRTVRHARKIRPVCSAYFEGYLFVSFDIREQRWSPINSTVGVRKLVMTNCAPIPVPFGVIETLLSATDDEGSCTRRVFWSQGRRYGSRTGHLRTSLVLWIVLGGLEQ